MSSITGNVDSWENIAILGVATHAMRVELDEMKITDFDLYDVVHTKAGWDRFVEELFHHKLRLIPGGEK